MLAFLLVALHASAGSDTRDSAAVVAFDVPKVFNVFQYGAHGDGKANDTAAIQHTIDAAGKVSPHCCCNAIVCDRENDFSPNLELIRASNLPGNGWGRRARWRTCNRTLTIHRSNAAPHKFKSKRKAGGERCFAPVFSL